jgi:tetratricopeptide (TPR) repeat protein
MTEQKKSRRQVLEEFVAQKPDDAFSRYGLALECMNSGDTDSALQHFHELVARNASYVPAYLMYGQLLARESRLDEARRILALGIEAAGQQNNSHARSEMESLLAGL